MNTTDILSSGNNDGGIIQGDVNFATNIGGENFQSSQFEGGATTSMTQITTTGTGGVVMGVGGGVEDNAKDVTYSTKNDQAFAFGTGGTTQTTTTTTTTTTQQYGYGTSGAEGASSSGVSMGFGGIGDSAGDVTYSTNADGAGVGLGMGAGQMTTTTTTETTQYGAGAGGEGLLTFQALNRYLTFFAHFRI
jgi:hypothetical protein